MREGNWGRVAATAVFVTVLAACGGGAGNDDTLHVVATTTVLGDVVANVVGDDARLEVLFPVGADPHEYQPSSQQVAALSSADLVVANGLGLEGGLADVLHAAEEDGANVLEVGPLLDPLPLGEGHCDPAAEHHHDHEGGDELGCDPHVWMDPLRMADAARAIATELAEIDAEPDWAGRAEAYALQLQEADAAIQDTLAAIPPERRLLVTNHDNLGYFAARYGFEIVGTVIPGGATLAEPSSEELAALVDVMRSHDVTVIVAETIEPATLAEAVAAELGDQVQVVELHTDSLGEPGSGADTLIGMLTTNAELLAAALGGG